MRFLSAATGLMLIAGLVGCTSADREQAKEDAKKAGREIKTDAKDLSRRVDAAVKPDGEPASDKMAHAEAIAKADASRAGVKLDQAALLAKVKTKMMSDAGLGTLTNVDVSVTGSVVTLTGSVVSENQKKAAEMAASQVDGVTRVQDNLVVKN